MTDPRDFLWRFEERLAEMDWVDGEERLAVSKLSDGHVEFIGVDQADTWGDEDRHLARLVLSPDQAGWLCTALATAIRQHPEGHDRLTVVPS